MKRAVRLAQQAMHDGQSQPGVLALAFGGEVGLKDFWQNFRSDSWSVVLNGERDQRCLVVESFAVDEQVFRPVDKMRKIERLRQYLAANFHAMKLLGALQGVERQVK